MLSVSQVIPIKGIHLVLEAMHLIKEKDQLDGVRFDIYGDVPASYKKELNILIGQYGLKGHVAFRGWLPREKVRQRFVQYDACLHPSLREEPFGIAILEAMAKGTPVIATSSGGPAEVIHHGFTGMLFPMGDTARLADMILQLKNDDLLWKRISRRSWEMVKKDFSLTSIMDEIEACLLKWAGSGGGGKTC